MGCCESSVADESDDVPTWVDAEPTGTMVDVRVCNDTRLYGSPETVLPSFPCAVAPLQLMESLSCAAAHETMHKFCVESGDTTLHTNHRFVMHIARGSTLESQWVVSHRERSLGTEYRLYNQMSTMNGYRVTLYWVPLPTDS